MDQVEPHSAGTPAVGDSAANFCLWGALGSAVPVGLALARPESPEKIMPHFTQ